MALPHSRLGACCGSTGAGTGIAERPHTPLPRPLEASHDPDHRWRWFSIRLAYASLLLFALVPSTPAVAAESPCGKTYTRAHFHSAARSTFRHPTVPASKRRTLHRIVRCQRRDVSRRIVRRSLRRYKAAHARRFYWQDQFARLPGYEQAWAYSTGACESGNNPRTNTGNGFYGAFQFVLSTAWAAGFTRRPDLTSWHEQAVRSVRWKWRTSDEQWPVCGD